jgi:hypothetical protein
MGFLIVLVLSPGESVSGWNQVKTTSLLCFPLACVTGMGFGTLATGFKLKRGAMKNGSAAYARGLEVKPRPR